MSLCAQIDVINFQHSGAHVRYDGKFYSSSDSYNVALSNAVNIHDTQVSNVLNSHLNRPTTYEQFNLTIYWKKSSHKFIRVKVCELGTETILFEKSIVMPILSKRSASLIVVKKKPAIYVISIIKSADIVEFQRILSQFGFEVSNDNKKELEQLSTDIKNLLDTNTLSDVGMTNGKNMMHLHKLILSARSPVFEKMFQCLTKRNLEGSITIEDISFQILKVLVNYMYSGAVKIENSRMARDLYIAADKLDVQNLKQICLSKLKSMEAGDVLDNLLLAHKYDESALKEAALNFIVDNYFIVAKLENWDNFKKEHLDLTNEILSLRGKK